MPLIELLTAVPPLAPEPPYHLNGPSKTTEYVFGIVQTVVCLAAFGYAIVASRRAKNLIPFMCMIGGALTVFLEPLIDSHLQVWWPTHHQPDVLNVWGRDIPLMLLPIVTWYFGLNAAIRYRWMQKNGPATRLWTLYAIEVGSALLLEPPGIQLGLWDYYGNQGPRIFGYPAWWPFAGGACCMAAGTLVYLLAPHLTGLKVLLVAPIIPIGVSAVYWGIGWPMFNVLNTEAPAWVLYPAAASSVGLCFLVVWICTVATGNNTYRKQQRQARRAAAHASPGEPQVTTVSA